MEKPAENHPGGFEMGGMANAGKDNERRVVDVSRKACALGEGGVIGLDELVSWLEAGLLDTRHGWVFTGRRAGAPEE